MVMCTSQLPGDISPRRWFRFCKMIKPPNGCRSVVLANSCEGADLVGSTTPTIHLLCAILDGELLVSEADLLVHANCLIDLQHGSHNVLVGDFVSANQVHFVLKLFDLIVTAQIFDGCKQMFFLAFGNELGSPNALRSSSKS